MNRLYGYAKDLNQDFWMRVGRAVAVDKKSVAIFRIIFGLFLLLFQTPTYRWILKAPAALFDPPILSLAYLFDGFLPSTYFYLLDGVILISLICITVGIKARPFTTLLFVLQFV